MECCVPTNLSMVSYSKALFFNRLLNCDQRDLVYTNVGVIVNMMSDSDKRMSLRTMGGVSSLINVLRDCGGPPDTCDWLLASLSCQV